MPKKKLKKCVFCRENDADSKDHIFSKSLFPPLLQVNYDGYTVPACKECNNAFSQDEELFRNLITAFGLESSPQARILWDTKIRKSVQRRPSLAKAILKKMELVDLYTTSGIYVGEKAKITIDVETKERINNVLIKYTKGLFYKHFESEIPSDYEIRVAWSDEIKNILNLLKKVKPTAKVGNVLGYGYNYVEGTHNSVWLYLFYEKMPFMVLVVDETVTGNK